MKTIMLTAFFFSCFFTGFCQVTPTVWQRQQTVAYPGKQDDICFTDASNGWYCNGQGKIYHTTNGGTNWNLIFEKPGIFFRCIGFIDSLKGFAGNVGTNYFPNVKDTVPIYQTNDGGKTWEPVTYTGPYVKGLCAIDIVKKQYINHGAIDYKYHIYGVGRVGSPASMLVSYDAGKTFTSWSMNNDCKMLFDIKMFNKNEGFVCAATSEDISASNALILYTKDGGKIWAKKFQSNRPFETTWKVSFPSRKVGYVTIQSYNLDTTVKQQRVAKTIDGGYTWHEVNLCADATLVKHEMTTVKNVKAMRLVVDRKNTQGQVNTLTVLIFTQGANSINAIFNSRAGKGDKKIKELFFNSI